MTESELMNRLMALAMYARGGRARGEELVRVMHVVRMVQRRVEALAGKRGANAAKARRIVSQLCWLEGVGGGEAVPDVVREVGEAI